MKDAKGESAERRFEREEMNFARRFGNLGRIRLEASAQLRSRLLGLLVFVAAIVLAYNIGGWVLTGNLPATAKRLGTVAGAVVLVAVFMRWRPGVYLFLVWLTFEDLIRKYSGNSMTVYFTKDLLVLTIYAGFLISLARRETRTFRPPFLIPLACFLGLGVVQVFNPRSTSFFYGILGVKLYFLYIPLMFASYALIDSEAELKRFFRITLWTGGAVALVGIIQGLGYRNFLNPSGLAPALQALGHLRRAVPTTGEILNAPPSVFVSQGRYATYLVLLLILTLAYVGYQLLRRERGKLAYVVLGLTSVAVFLAGSRGVLVYSLMTVFLLGAGFLWGTKYQVLARARLTKAIRRSLVALALGMALVTWVSPRITQGWWSLYYETLWPNSPYSQLAYRVKTYPLREFEKAVQYPHWAVGYGTGTSSLGAQYVTGVLHQPSSATPAVENGFGTMILEMGILAPILWVWWAVALLWSAWKALERLKGTALFPVGFAIIWYIFWLLIPQTWGSIAAYQNFAMNAYLWVLVGILFRLPKLANQSRTGALAAAPARPVEVPVRVGSS
jgi:hypothetical protein